MATMTATVLTAREWAVEVDTTLADFWDVQADLALPLKWAKDAVWRVAGMVPVGTKESRYSYEAPKPRGTFAQALQCVEALAAQAPADRPWESRYAVEALAKYSDAKAKMDEVLEAEEPFNDEYRLVRWSRAWLVLNTGGHVHRDRDCSTCYPTTSYGWLPQLSGADEAYIVEQSGADACTVCFPSAPVESLSRPRRAMHRTEVEAQIAREARAAAKAEKEAKKAAKSLPEPVKVFRYHYGERHYQQRDGSIRIEPAYDTFDTLETVHAAKAWLTDSQESWTRDKRPEDVQRVAEALADKNGTTPEAEIAAAAKRAAKRR
jgi:hypothetical protein